MWSNILTSFTQGGIFNNEVKCAGYTHLVLYLIHAFKPKIRIMRLPRGDQPRARPDLRVYSISHSTSKLACLWALLFQLLVDFGPFWSIFGQLDPSPDPVLRVSSLLRFESDGRRASGTVDVLNTVRAIEVHQAHDASWNLVYPWREPARSLPGCSWSPVFGRFLAKSSSIFTRPTQSSAQPYPSFRQLQPLTLREQPSTSRVQPYPPHRPQVMSRAAKGSGPKCCILLFPRGDQRLHEV
jgi:hypothetical protein